MPLQSGVGKRPAYPSESEEAEPGRKLRRIDRQIGLGGRRGVSAGVSSQTRANAAPHRTRPSQKACHYPTVQG